MLRSALEIAGYSVAIARDGKMAVAAQRESPADVLITDIFMPDSDGFEAIEAFRKNFPSTRIIAISAGRRSSRPTTSTRRCRSRSTWMSC